MPGAASERASQAESRALSKMGALGVQDWACRGYLGSSSSEASGGLMSLSIGGVAVLPAPRGQHLEELPGPTATAEMSP